VDNKLQSVQKITNEYINESNDKVKNASHAYGVSGFSALLAKKRGLNPTISAVAGLLHDISFIRTGTYDNHDKQGADMAREILSGTGLFEAEEIEIIYNAILRHDLRQEQHEPYDEVLKDADIIYPYFTQLPTEPNPSVADRLAKVLGELLHAG